MSLPDGFRSEVRCYKGYDYRDDPSDGRGAHGMTLSFILHGPEAVVSADIRTGWMRYPLVGSYVRGAGPQRRRSNVGMDGQLSTHYPTGSNVTIHSPMKLKDWWLGPDKCNLLPVGECYGDSGYIVADHVLVQLVEGGDEAVWPYLIEIYHSWLKVDDFSDAAS